MFPFFLARNDMAYPVNQISALPSGVYTVLATSAGNKGRPTLLYYKQELRLKLGVKVLSDV